MTKTVDIYRVVVKVNGLVTYRFKVAAETRVEVDMVVGRFFDRHGLTKDLNATYEVFPVRGEGEVIYSA